MSQRPYRCIHTDRAALAGRMCKWPAGTLVTWYLDPSSVPLGLSYSETLKAITAGIGIWPQVCGLQAARVNSPEQARVFISFRPIDGSNGILGQTQLPCEGLSNVQHTMQLDNVERWDADFLRRVVMHEFGHAIGLEHAPDGTVAVMAKYYDRSLDYPQPWDVAEAQKRCGPAPANQPTPAPKPVSQTVTLPQIPVNIQLDDGSTVVLTVTPTFSFSVERK